jgi:hypothetical protein
MRAAAVLAAAVLVLVPTSTSTQRYLTGYDWYDNDPPNSAAIAYPVIHRQAGGIGTYADPITAAVGTSHGVPDLKPGTRFYVPTLRRYFIVEDQCAECTAHWYDLWVDGRTDTKKEAYRCMSKITGTRQVILNPPRDYRVVAGAIARNHGCTALYPETP